MSAVNDQEAAHRTVKFYSVRDFFRRPEKHQFTISPDGRHLSFLTRHAGRQNIFVQKIGVDGSPVGDAQALTNESERDVPGHAWKGNDRILFVKDFGGDENFHVLSVPIHGGEPVDLTPFDGVKASIVDDLRDDDRHILIQMNRRDPQVFDVFRVDVVTGAFTPIAENPGNIMGWMTDHAGSLRVATASDGVNTTLLYRDTETEPFRPILTTNFRETVSPLFFTFDDQRLYVLSNRGRDKTAIFEFDPHTAQEGELLFETEHVDVSGLAFSKHRRVLTAAWYVDDRMHRHFFDEWARSIHEDLGRQLPGQEIAVTSITRDESRAIVHASSDLSPGSIWTYDIASRHLSRLTELMPWLDAADMARMEPIRFVARDGLQINGYLTLPAGIELGQKLKSPLPLIVNPHGGPWARDSWGFNSEAQLLANRGYAVLQLNFRGSTGYGRAFWEASFGQWGKSMQNDIDDGIDWLVAQGLADPARVGIYGASYGGYAVLAGVAFTPDPLCGRGRLCRRLESVHATRIVATVLEADDRHDVRDDRQPANRNGQAGAARCIAAILCGPNRDAAICRARRERSASQASRERPDRARAARAWDRRQVHAQRQRRARLPKRRKSVRVLRSHGSLPRAAPGRPLGGVAPTDQHRPVVDTGREGYSP